MMFTNGVECIYCVYLGSCLCHTLTWVSEVDTFLSVGSRLWPFNYFGGSLWSVTTVFSGIPADADYPKP